MPEIVRHRGTPPWLWFSVALVAILEIFAAVAFGPRLVDAVVGTAQRPFDRRTVGVTCRDDQAWVCGSIRVPFDRGSPRAGSVNVRFRVLTRRLVAKESAGTVVIVAGGPGESSMSQYAWARSAFHSLLADHDLLLVDNRGSGASDAIYCPQAQRGLSRDAVAQCKASLGSRADDYGTVAAVDDLEGVLTRIHARKIDLYAESYGTFFAQVFALRHPQRLHRLVLDGAVPLDVDPWSRASLPAALANLKRVCRAQVRCRESGDPVALIRDALPIIRLGSRVEQTSVDSAADLASLLVKAGHRGSAYRELPAALHAMLGADPAPLIRLMDEARAGGAGSGSAASTSNAGLYLADMCADFTQPFDLRAPLALQERQVRSAYKRIVASNARTFLPFTPEEALPDVSLCLGWPAPTRPSPQSLERRFPNVPTLVLEGALDTITPPPGARAVAHAFRRHKYLEIPFVGHIAALNDRSGCAAKIAAAFLASRVVDTACLSRIPVPTEVDAFPERFAQETPITLIEGHGTSGLTADDARTVAIARDVISDVLRRWGPLGFSSTRGLRGGSFTTIAPLQRGEFRVRLDGIRWTTDTTVTGELETSPTRGTMKGSVVVSTPTARARFDILASHILEPSTHETFSGTIRGQNVELTFDARFGS